MNAPADGDGSRQVIRVLIRRGDGASWQAQVLESDVRTIGASRSAALDTLVKVVQVHVAFDIRLGREPLSMFATAPDDDWTEFDRASKVAEPVELSHRSRARVLCFLVANALDEHSTPTQLT
jgi:hypothetical protein